MRRKRGVRAGRGEIYAPRRRNPLWFSLIFGYFQQVCLRSTAVRAEVRRAWTSNCLGGGAHCFDIGVYAPNLFFYQGFFAIPKTWRDPRLYHSSFTTEELFEPGIIVSFQLNCGSMNARVWTMEKQCSSSNCVVHTLELVVHEVILLIRKFVVSVT